MKILLTGSDGGIGSAIKKRLKGHDVIAVDRYDFEYGFNSKEEFDWLICAHGMLDEEEVLDTFHANVISQIYLAEDIKAKHVLFISSTSALEGNDKYPVYSASKAALNMYAKLKGYYVLCPGATDTPLWRSLNMTTIDGSNYVSSSGIPQPPDDVAKAVEYIISGKSGKLVIVRNGKIT